MMEKIPPNLARSGAIEIAEKLKHIHGGKILDVGTGDGNSILSLISFLRSYDSAIGIDIDEKEMKKARFRVKERPITIKKMSGEKLEFPDNTFDLVNIAYSMHHIQNLTKALNEMRRVLKKGGYFLIKEMFSDGNQTNAQECDTAAHEFGAEIDRLLGIYHREEFTRDEILEILPKRDMKDWEILESSRDNRCLKWKENVNCEDPKTSGEIDFTLEEIEKSIERIKEHKEYSKFKERAKPIKQSIKHHGISSASILFCIGQKED
ncbi:MAG: class I SAM-dependent methyltransferase [Promethearchaeota archaeon]|jgi:ubiquinone/menaquinone biosynthesis C-methylase UbiE